MSNSTIIEVLELINSQGEKSGNWRLTIRAAERANASGLCNHLHNSYESAWNCTEAWLAAKKITGDSG